MCAARPLPTLGELHDPAGVQNLKRWISLGTPSFVCLFVHNKQPKELRWQKRDQATVVGTQQMGDKTVGHPTYAIIFEMALQSNADLAQWLVCCQVWHTVNGCG